VIATITLASQRSDVCDRSASAHADPARRPSAPPRGIASDWLPLGNGRLGSLELRPNRS
jgi:hypothetical protein